MTALPVIIERGMGVDLRSIAGFLGGRRRYRAADVIAFLAPPAPVDHLV